MDERAKMLHNAKKFEELAVGVLSACQSSDADKTSAMLSATIPMFKNQTPIDVAYQSESLKFLSHPATQSVVNRAWFGSLKTMTKGYRVVLGLIMPFLILPFIELSDSKVWGLLTSPVDLCHLLSFVVIRCQIDDGGGSAYFVITHEGEISSSESSSKWQRVRRKFYNFYSAPYTRYGSASRHAAKVVMMAAVGSPSTALRTWR